MSDSTIRFDQIELSETIEFGDERQVTATVSNSSELQFSDLLNGDLLIPADDTLNLDVNNSATSNFGDVTPFAIPDIETVASSRLDGEPETIADLISDLISDLPAREISDPLFGAGDADVLAGDFSNGLLAGGGGDDVLIGNDGDNILQGGPGDDILDGGEGNDTADFSDIPFDVTADLTAGTAQYAAASGATVIDSLSNIENLTGSANNDFLTGNDGGNLLGGDIGDDTLLGGGGGDILTGGGGDDSLQGGAGDDRLDGGVGIDTLHFDDIDVGVAADLTAGSAERDTGFDLTLADVPLVDPNEGIAADQIVSAGIAGNLYFNFHTNDFPSGELRGQLALVADNRDANGVGAVEFTASLSGDQEVPAPTDTDSSGTATTLLTVASDGSVTYSTEVSLAGLNQADLLPVDIGNGTLSPIHLHNAAVGVNGPVVVDVATDAGPGGIVAISETDSLSGIENVAGSNDADIIIGDANNNVLEGLDGDDTLEGGSGNDTLNGGFGDDLLQGGGNDTLNGGDGFDTISFADIGAEVAVTLNEDGSGSAEYVVNGDTVVDTFTNIEAVVGSENNDNITLAPLSPDTFTAEGGADLLAGFSGDDTLEGGFGEDSLLGGDGDVIAEIETFASEGLDGLPEIVSGSFEGIADLLLGNGDAEIFDSSVGNSLLSGGGGDDVLIGNDGDNILQGGAGNDVLDGGEGNDTADFSDIPFEVTADLTAGTAQYVAASGATVIDSLSNLENLTGSANNDSLTGDDGDNLLAGAGGDDTLLGGGGDDILEGGFGNDFLQGGGGNDTLDGGDGFDTVSFADIGAEVTVTLNEDGSGSAEYVVNGVTVVDTFTNIEAIVGSENNDNITLTPLESGTFAFDSGDDLLGGLGAAAPLGGFGEDSLLGGDGDAIFEVGNTLTENDQVLAQLDLTLADAAITAQDDEFDGVQPSLDDLIAGGFATFDDILTGNSTLAGGFANGLSNVDGEASQFTAISPELLGVARAFDRFPDLINQDAFSRLGSIGGEASLTDALPTDSNVGTLVADIITQPNLLASQRNFVA